MEIQYTDCKDVQAVWDGIKRLAVRGAPAIGVAAAFGCVIAVQGNREDEDKHEDEHACKAKLKAAANHLATSRPTAVNLFWALDRMQTVTPCTPDALLDEAKLIHAEDAAMCRQIGENGLTLIENLCANKGDAISDGFDGMSMLTHCNAGALATGGIGTATAPMYVAHEQGKRLRVFADETRPLLQGSRLTAFELAEAGIDVTIICDDMAAQVLREGKIDVVITGADRIAANGDAANKIGTYGVAIMAKYHRVPFIVAAPSSTFDLVTSEGDQIPIELREAEEITKGFGKRTAPTNAKTYSPAFDVTPNDLITAIVTERGVIQPVNAQQVAKVLGV